MPSITYDLFDGGLDRRKGPSSAGANQLRELTNGYVTRGKEIRKRPGSQTVINLVGGSIGLSALLGKLATFSDDVAIDHLSADVTNYMLPHPTDANRSLAKVWVADVFRGYIFVSSAYDDGSVWMHYLDEPGAWLTATVYAVGVFRRPTIPNGYRYEVTAKAGTGTSGAVEPVWPTVVGTTVIDNAGANQLTWTCRSYVVTDVNCPHSKFWAKIGDKIFAADGEDMTYCKTGDARDWTTGLNAGFKAVGSMVRGVTAVTCIAAFGKDIVVFFTDGIQIWSYDADPSLIELKQSIYNVGTAFPRSPIEMANNTFFLSSSGFRSIAVAQQVDVLQDTDIGAPIDDIIKAEISATDNPFSVFFPALGQFWLFNGQNVYSYAFSRTSKVSAWGKNRLSTAVDAACQLGGKLYIRVGQAVKLVSEDYYTDDGELFEVVIELPYQDAKAPGILKQFLGVDAVVEGTFNLQIKYDPRDTSLITSAVPLSGDTSPGDLIPVELCATAIAPRLTHTANEKFVLSSMTFYFESLGRA